MSIDLNFWKYQKDVYLDNAMVYQKACCDMERVKGLEVLPIESILQETAAAFPEWTSQHGSFQISTTPQAVRFDCYSMEQADMKRLCAVMSKFDCPLYDSQLGVRFDKLTVFLIDEADNFQKKAAQELSRLLPRLEITTLSVSWDDYVQRPKNRGDIVYNALIHRAKKQTKVTSFLQAGSFWSNRPCQCKTAQLTDKDTEQQIFEDLLQQSIARVVNDFLEKTYYSPL
ncbi:MAG: hypothetical protein K2P63_01565 [Lachnospiraceae bacterium]|nr:hypothetical protein [Lachnospiraceae bacterium]